MLSSATLVPLDAGVQAKKPRYKTKTVSVSEGLVLKKILDRAGPNRIWVLELNPQSDLTLDVALANEQIPGHETTTSMADRHNAIAAINGDYTILPGKKDSGRPVGIFIEDGYVVTSPLIWGRNFSIARNERRTFFGHTEVNGWLAQLDGPERWPIYPYNGYTLPPDGLAAFTMKGGNAFKPPRNSCATRLFPTGPLRWIQTATGVTQSHVVDEVGCYGRKLSREGGLVLAAPSRSPQSVSLVQHLVAGETVDLAWTLGWKRVLDTIGGNPTIIERGVYTAGGCTGSAFCGRNPRTAVGVTADGTLLLVTVDGRRKTSVGMTLDELGVLFEYLDATWALNLDGGGSTTMVVQGDILNRPSDGNERAVGSSLLVLPDVDAAEPPPQPYSSEPSPGPIPTPLPLDPVAGVAARMGLPAACDASTDPASTGGMLDALARGDLAGPTRLGPLLARTLAEYRLSDQCGFQSSSE